MLRGLGGPVCPQAEALCSPSFLTPGLLCELAERAASLRSCAGGRGAALLATPLPPEAGSRCCCSGPSYWPSSAVTWAVPYHFSPATGTLVELIPRASKSRHGACSANCSCGYLSGGCCSCCRTNGMGLLHSVSPETSNEVCQGSLDSIFHQPLLC